MSSRKARKSLDPYYKIYDCVDRINNSRSIPASARDELEQRFEVTFTVYERRPAKSNGGRPGKERMARYTRKRAAAMYLNICEYDPQILIPVLLTVSVDQARRGFDLEHFKQHHEVNKRILDLDAGEEATFQAIARRCGFATHPQFINLMDALFLPKAEKPLIFPKDVIHQFQGAKLQSLPGIFGRDLPEVIMRTPLENTTEMVGAIRLELSSSGVDDAVMHIDVHTVYSIQAKLFPNTCSVRGEPDRFTSTPTYQKGACITGCYSTFSPRILDAILTSQQYMWEKSIHDPRLRPTITRCVALEVRDQEAELGTLHLCLKALKALAIGRILFRLGT